ncbi:myosin-11-like [Portunus trituberculatus]|uniref:myosin-11-like n=1 Tax=Portunus trituberculatus TaxID=210409 RepID=UPI001E1CD1E4|nr:myosin-11-like [Portunus trituberculatus]
MEKVAPEVGRDDITNKYNEYATKVMKLTQALEVRQAYKAELRNKLNMITQRTDKLNSQVDRVRVRKKREREELECIEQLNKELQAAEEELKRSRFEEIRAHRLELVSKFEDEMRVMRSKFQALMPERKDDGSEDIAKELVHLEEEVARLEDERNSLLTAVDSDNFSADVASLQLTTVEDTEFLDTLQQRNRKLKDEEAVLKQELESLRLKKKAGSGQHHTTQQ